MNLTFLARRASQIFTRSICHTAFRYACAGLGAAGSGERRAVGAEHILCRYILPVFPARIASAASRSGAGDEGVAIAGTDADFHLYPDAVAWAWDIDAGGTISAGRIGKRIAVCRDIAFHGAIGR